MNKTTVEDDGFGFDDRKSSSYTKVIETLVKVGLIDNSPSLESLIRKCRNCQVTITRGFLRNKIEVKLCSKHKGML